MKRFFSSVTRVLLFAGYCLPCLAHGEVDLDEGWKRIVSEERDRHSPTRFWETGISGIAVFSIGAYGANFDGREFVTSSIYAVMQTGGLILMSQSLRDYLGESPMLSMDSFFSSRQQMSKREMQKIFLQTIRKNERAATTADLFLWSGLSLVYLQTALKESKSNSTMRSLYFFLSANSGILASASAFKLFFETNENQLSSRDVFSLSTSGQSVSLQWKHPL